MEKTNQTDPELDALKGKVPGLEDTGEDADKEKEAEDAKAKEEADAKATADQKAKEDANVAAGLNPDGSAKDDEDDKKSSRPEKYIPIKQYTDEKKQWRESEASYKERIGQLEAIAGGKEGSKKTETAVKEYAEKYGVDEESVRDLAKIIKGEDKPPVNPETPIKPEDQKLLDEAREIEANQLFAEEFNTLAKPEIKSLFPNATQEQIESAKAELEKLACTSQYLDKSLDFIVYKEKANLGKLFVVGRKGPESSHTAPDKGKATYTADDFKGGKTPFSVLADLSGDEQNTIIEKMDMKTYESWSNWNVQNDPIVINRKGRKL